MQWHIADRADEPSDEPPADETPTVASCEVHWETSYAYPKCTSADIWITDDLCGIRAYNCNGFSGSVSNAVSLGDVHRLEICAGGWLDLAPCEVEPAPPGPDDPPTARQCAVAWQESPAVASCSDWWQVGLDGEQCRIQADCDGASRQTYYASIEDTPNLHYCFGRMQVEPCPEPEPPPELPSADEQCEDQWSLTQAAASCEASSVSATETGSYDEPLECSVEASCETQEQGQVEASTTVAFDEMHLLVNCNGTLRRGDCHSPYRPPFAPEEPCAANWYNAQASYQCFDAELNPIGDGGPYPEQCEVTADCQNLHSGDSGPDPELVPNNITVDVFDIASLQVCHGQLQVSGWCDPSQPPGPPPFDGTCEEGWPQSPAASSCTDASVETLDSPPQHCNVEATCPDAAGEPTEASIMIVLDEIVNLRNCNGNLIPGVCPAGTP